MNNQTSRNASYRIIVDFQRTISVLRQVGVFLTVFMAIFVSKPDTVVGQDFGWTGGGSTGNILDPANYHKRFADIPNDVPRYDNSVSVSNRWLPFSEKSSDNVFRLDVPTDHAFERLLFEDYSDSGFPVDKFYGTNAVIRSVGGRHNFSVGYLRAFSNYSEDVVATFENLDMNVEVLVAMSASSSGDPTFVFKNTNVFFGDFSQSFQNFFAEGSDYQLRVGHIDQYGGSGTIRLENSNLLRSPISPRAESAEILFFNAGRLALSNGTTDLRIGHSSIETDDIHEALILSQPGTVNQLAGGMNFKGVVAMEIGSQLIISGDRENVIHGPIIGTGQLRNDADRLTLAGTNTFSGGLVLGNGNVQVNSGQRLGALSNTIYVEQGFLEATGSLGVGIPIVVQNGGGGGINLNNHTVDITRGISGTGTFVVKGTAGNSGTLRLLSDSPNFNGTLQVDSGAVLQIGGNPNALDTLGENTHLQINGGKASLHQNQGWGSLGGDSNSTFVTNGRVMRVNGRSDGLANFAGILYGGGEIRKTGTGIQSFSGDNRDFTGSWQVEAGSIDFYGPNSMVGNVQIESGASVTHYGGGTYGGLISGEGQFVKMGDNTLTLSGVNFDEGRYRVDQGTLNVQGVLVGHMLLDGGTLEGNGTFVGLVAATDDSVIAPGNSAGAMYIETALFEAGSTLSVELGGVMGSEYDQLLTNETFILGGELSVSLLDLGNGEFMPSETDLFTILTASQGRFGGFSNVTNGQRIGTAGSEGSFLVNYNDQSIVLSNFSANSVPEPGSAALFLIGTMVLLCRRNSRQ